MLYGALFAASSGTVIVLEGFCGACAGAAPVASGAGSLTPRPADGMTPTDWAASFTTVRIPNARSTASTPPRTIATLIVRADRSGARSEPPPSERTDGYDGGLSRSGDDLDDAGGIPGAEPGLEGADRTTGAELGTAGGGGGAGGVGAAARTGIGSIGVGTMLDTLSAISSH